MFKDKNYCILFWKILALYKAEFTFTPRGTIKKEFYNEKQSAQVQTYYTCILKWTHTNAHRSC